MGLEVVSAQVAEHLGISIDEKSSVLLVRFAGNKKGVEYQSHQSSEELRWSKIEIIERDESLWQTLTAIPLHESSQPSAGAPASYRGRFGTCLNKCKQFTEIRSTRRYGSSVLRDGRMRVMNNEEHRLNESREATRVLGGSFVSETEGALYVGSSSGIMHRIKQQLDPQSLFPMRWNQRIRS